MDGYYTPPTGPPADPHGPAGYGPPGPPPPGPTAGPGGPSHPVGPEIVNTGWRRPDPAPGSPAGPRPRPDLPTALAGTGVGVAVLGLLNWSGDIVGSSVGTSGSGDPSTGARLGGFAIGAVLTVLGYLLAVRVRRGVLVTAGVGASALGVPITLAWLTFGDHGAGHLPIQLDAVALGSIALWLASWLWVPVVRRHTFYLVGAVTTLWVYVLLRADNRLISFPSSYFESLFIGREPQRPDWLLLAGLSLSIALIYYAVGRLLDAHGSESAATPFTAVAFVALAAGVLFAQAETDHAWIALVSVVAGAVAAAAGSRSGRRFTLWAGCALFASGVLDMIAGYIKHNQTASGLVAVAAGAGLVALAAVLAKERGLRQ